MSNLNELIEDADKEVVLDATDESKTTRDNKEVSETKLFTSPIVPGKVPEAVQEFEMSADRLKDTVRLVRHAAEIKDRGSVSQEDMQLAYSLSKEIISEDSPIGIYTQTPTKTNINQALSNIDTAIEHNWDEIRQALLSHISTYTQLNTDYISSVESKLAAYYTQGHALMERILKEHNCNDLELVQIVLNNGMTLKKLLRSEIFNCSLNVKGTFAEEILTKAQDVLSSGFLDTYNTAIDSKGSSIKLGMNNYTFKDTDGVMTLEPIGHSEGYRPACYGEVLTWLAGSQAQGLLQNVLACYGSYLGAIGQEAKAIEALASSREPIAFKLKAAMNISSRVSSLMGLNQKLSVYIGQYFELYDLYLALLQKLSETNNAGAVIKAN